jgi:hypothetical protein
VQQASLFPCAAAKIDKDFPIIEEISAQDFGDAESFCFEKQEATNIKHTLIY